MSEEKPLFSVPKVIPAKKEEKKVSKIEPAEVQESLSRPVRVSHPSRRDKLSNFKSRADKSGGTPTD